MQLQASLDLSVFSKTRCEYNAPKFGNVSRRSRFRSVVKACETPSVNMSVMSATLYTFERLAHLIDPGKLSSGL
jgi:hypothetical protein